MYRKNSEWDFIGSGHHLPCKICTNCECQNWVFYLPDEVILVDIMQNISI